MHHKQEVIRKGAVQWNTTEATVLDLTVKPILEQSAMRGLMMVVFEETEPAAKAKKMPADPPSGEAENALSNARTGTAVHQGKPANHHRRTGNLQRRTQVDQRRAAVDQRGTAEHQRRAGDLEGGTAVAQRGVGHRQRRTQARIDELSKTNDDMKNLLDSTEIATIFLDTGFVRQKAQAESPSTRFHLSSGQHLGHFGRPIFLAFPSIALIYVDLAEKSGLEF